MSIILFLFTHQERTVLRLFFQNGEGNDGGHYSVINVMSQLVGSQLGDTGHKRYVCDYCLNRQKTEELLVQH